MLLQVSLVSRALSLRPQRHSSRSDLSLFLLRLRQDGVINYILPLSAQVFPRCGLIADGFDVLFQVVDYTVATRLPDS